MIRGWTSLLLVMIVLGTVGVGLPAYAAAQSRLPPCPADQMAQWDRCYGTYTWPNGVKYVGEYRDDKFNGHGTYTWPNGAKYVGEFKDGERNGQGTLTAPNGDRYVGEYRDGKFNGHGTYTWPNGEKYVGEYRDDKRNGQGTYQPSIP